MSTSKPGTVRDATPNVSYLDFPSKATSPTLMAHSDLWFTVTGCIRPETLDRLDPNDAGGQYDSNGGSICSNYGFYVELVEPLNSRACIRCCENLDDCPTNEDTKACPAVIPGNYFDCL